MTIIKIHLYRHQSPTQQKYLLTYIPQIHKTIGCFIQFAINALDIDNCSTNDLVVENDGYILPQCLDCKVIEKMDVLTIRVKGNKERKTQSPSVVGLWTAQKFAEDQKENVVEENLVVEGRLEEEDQHSEESTPKFSEDGIRKHKKQNALLKEDKQKEVKQTPSRSHKKSEAKNKKAKKVSKQSSSQQQIEQVKKLPKKPQLSKGKKLDSFQEQSSPSQSIKQPSESGNQSSSESSQSSQEELPRVVRTKKVQLQQKMHEKKKQQQKHKVVEKKKAEQSVDDLKKDLKKKKIVSEKYQSEEQQLVKPEVKQVSRVQKKKQQPVPKQVTVTYAQRKRLIDADDIESSDNSQLEEIKKLPTSINGQFQAKQQNAPLKYAQPQSKMLPPSLRNKPQPQKTSPFKTHQLQQWLPITQQLLAKHKSSLSPQEQQIPFLKANNLIKFKQIQLDEQRFVPKQSEWIEGTIQSVDVDGRLRLSKVTQLGKQYRQRYDVYEYNMVVLEVNRNFLTNEQREVVGEGESVIEDKKDRQVEDNTIVQQLKETVITGQPQVQPQKQQKNSLQKFICGQVNFYFSDKNYPFDLFMQMHANKHPQKYIPIRFLLNFPKIKKMLKDQHKLLDFLIHDEKRTDRNFQLNQETRMVRKRFVIKNIEEIMKKGQEKENVGMKTTEHNEEQLNE